jgi:hypothetical protein
MTWGRGILVTNARANAADALFPLLMGIAEFMLFAVLIQNLPDGHSALWLNWSLILAVPLTLNRWWNSRVKEYFEKDQEVQQVGVDMEKWILSDTFGATLMGLLALGAWKWVQSDVKNPMFGISAAALQAWLAGVFIVILLVVITKASAERNKLDAKISEIILKRQRKEEMAKEKTP